MKLRLFSIPLHSARGQQTDIGIAQIFKVDAKLLFGGGFDVVYQPGTGAVDVSINVGVGLGAFASGPAVEFVTRR